MGSEAVGMASVVRRLVSADKRHQTNVLYQSLWVDVVIGASSNGGSYVNFE